MYNSFLSRIVRKCFCFTSVAKSSGLHHDIAVNDASQRSGENSSSQAKPQPVIILLQGSWHTHAHYADILLRFREAGFLAEKPEYPSMGLELPRPFNTKDDIASCRKAILRLADAGHPIIIYMHSYGGVVGSDAVAGLTWKERNGKGGVVHMIYQAAYVVLKGSCLLSPYDGNLPDFIKEDIEVGNCWLTDPQRLCFSGLSDEEGRKWCSLLVNNPASTLRYIVNNEPWRKCPCTYLVCKSDQAMSQALQEDLAKILGKDTRIEYTDGGHGAFLDTPDRVVEVVKDVWKVASAYIDPTSQIEAAA